MGTRTAEIPRLDHLTHRGNGKHTRYGWLRLTPAFSVHLILDLVRELPPGAIVLDPFCGTGTTALVCAEEGVVSRTTDINPFLLWLAQVKCANYSKEEVSEARSLADSCAQMLREPNNLQPWIPPLFQIEKWWEPAVLENLGKIRSFLKSVATSAGPINLLKVAFCRTMIETAKVSFGHQSMSFKKSNGQLSLLPTQASEEVIANWRASTDSILKAAEHKVNTQPEFLGCDARRLTQCLERQSINCVITSPPYPNRMSYIRELRPYMYWLGYLTDAREAGELDWQAIGGTWGCATSNLTKWQRPEGATVPFKGLKNILQRIEKANAQSGEILARYVEKYFYDMAVHIDELAKLLSPRASVHYIVGNSKFYDVMLPVEEIFASLFEDSGLTNVTIDAIRKRTSKRELFEYMVTAQRT